jgi:hypothetical protein
MKKLFLTIGLVAAGSLAQGQGTVSFSNLSLYRNSTAQTLSFGSPTYSPSNAVPVSGTIAQSPTSLSLEYGLFYGIGQNTSLALLTAQFGVNSSTGNGLIASPADSLTPLNLVGIPGTQPNETDVWLQVRAWSSTFGTDWVLARNSFEQGNKSTFYGDSKIANITLGLGAATGPGAAIWTFSSNTTGTVIPAFVIFNPVPEPTSFALAGLGAATLLIFRRRK